MQAVAGIPETGVCDSVTWDALLGEEALQQAIQEACSPGKLCQHATLSSTQHGSPLIVAAVLCSSGLLLDWERHAPCQAVLCRRSHVVLAWDRYVILRTRSAFGCAR